MPINYWVMRIMIDDTLRADDVSMARIKGVSTFMATAVSIGIALLFITVTAIWWIDDLFAGMLDSASVSGVNVDSLPFYLRATSFAIALVPLGIYTFVLVQTRALFRGYAQGEIFTFAAAKRLRTIGCALVLGVPAGVVAGMLVSVVLTAANPAGQRQLSISFGSAEFSALVFGGLLLVIGWVMAEAARLAEENRQYI